MLTSLPPFHNNFHSFSYTEQGQKIVLYSKNTLAQGCSFLLQVIKLL